MSRGKWFHRPVEPVDVVQQIGPRPTTGTAWRAATAGNPPAVPRQLTPEARWGARNARKVNRGFWPHV